jgi:uncharacterized membrane protein
MLIAVLAPALVVSLGLLAGYVCTRSRLINTLLGPAVSAYLFGIIGGVWFPRMFHHTAADLTGQIAIAVALPVFLFSTDWSVFRSQSRKMFTGMLLAVVSIVVVVTAGHVLFPERLTVDAGAMLLGVYSGGTPNMAAIQIGLSLPKELFLLLVTFDTVFSAAYLVIIMLAGRKWLHPDQIETTPVADISKEDVPGKQAALILLAAVVVFSVSYLIGLSFSEAIRGAVVVSLVSVGGLFGSLNKKLRHDSFNEKAGLQLMLIFCVAIGSHFSTDVFSETGWQSGLMVGAVMVTAVSLHGLLCRLFNIPGAVYLISNVAAICSPPFIPAVAENIRKPSLIPSGIAAGVLGYAVGTFLGMGWYFVFR